MYDKWKIKNGLDSVNAMKKTLALSGKSRTTGSPDLDSARQIIKQLLNICENGQGWTSPGFMEDARRFLANDLDELPERRKNNVM